MLQYLTDKQGRYSTAEIRRVLFRNGYLAQALRDVGHDQYQVHALTKLLLAAFPKEHYPLGLDKATVTEILARTPDAPTPALLAAILRKIPVADAPQAWDAYVYGSIARMDLERGDARRAVDPAARDRAGAAPELDRRPSRCRRPSPGRPACRQGRA